MDSGHPLFGDPLSEISGSRPEALRILASRHEVHLSLASQPETTPLFFNNNPTDQAADGHTSLCNSYTQ